MRRGSVVLGLVGLLLGLIGLPGAAIAQAAPSGNLCDIDGHADLFARYEWRNQRVVLVSWASGEVVRVVESSLETPSFEAVNAPGTAATVAEVGGGGTVVWDVLTSARVAILPVLARSDGGPTGNTRFVWSPDGAYVLMTIDGGQALIWDTRHGVYTPLIVQSGPFLRVGWDLSRTQVLVVPSRAQNTVAAYDLRTGGQLALYHTAPTATAVTGCCPGMLRIVVYGSGGRPSRPRLFRLEPDTMQAIHLKAGALISLIDPIITLSPDARSWPWPAPTTSACGTWRPCRRPSSSACRSSITAAT
jgi:WD40 repeat protein